MSIISTSRLNQCQVIDLRQGIEVRHRHAFVDLVDGRVERAEFDHLRADIGDEAAVGSAAAGGEFGIDAGHLLDGGC